MSPFFNQIFPFTVQVGKNTPSATRFSGLSELFGCVGCQVIIYEDFPTFKLSSGSDEHATDMVGLELDYNWSRMVVGVDSRLSNAVNHVYILYDGLKIESHGL